MGTAPLRERALVCESHYEYRHFYRGSTTESSEFSIDQGHSVFRTRPCPSFPSPSTGEGEGGGEGRWRAPAMLLPPIPAFPRQGGRGGKAQGGAGKIEN